jgi:hypothetical protein
MLRTIFRLDQLWHHLASTAARTNDNDFFTLQVQPGFPSRGMDNLAFESLNTWNGQRGLGLNQTSDGTDHDLCANGFCVQD